MKFSTQFIPTADLVGLLPMLTYFFITATTYAFLACFIFSLATRTSVAPEHRLSQTLTACIVAVAGISYVLITFFFHDYLEELANVSDPDDRLTLTRQAYNAIGQYRYMDWAITTPLLLIKMVSMLRIRYRDAPKQYATLLAADFFMIVTGYVGEQQLTDGAQVLVTSKLIWGAVSTLGYVLIPLTLYRIWQQFNTQVESEERLAFRTIALTTVTFWGVYPIGYILTCIPSFDPNWIHLAFSIADVINKVGVGIITYLTAKELMDKRVPESASASAYGIS
ncbi:hypothetical protein GCM10027341_50790 [Spirosoma knui]